MTTALNQLCDPTARLDLTYRPNSLTNPIPSRIMDFLDCLINSLLPSQWDFPPRFHLAMSEHAVLSPTVIHKEWAGGSKWLGSFIDKEYYENMGRKKSSLIRYKQQDLPRFEKPRLRLICLIVFVQGRIKLLLIRRATHPCQHKLSLVGGFIARGEDAYQNLPA